jgi:hypothetical protein
MLGSQTDPTDRETAIIVDFAVFSVPTVYLRSHAESVPHRLRVASPYVEHFSQAFARYFMRVGLPSPLPSFK